MADFSGQLWDRFELLEKLVEGGVGEVYRARDGGSGREVVIEFLPEETEKDRGGLEELERTARAVVGLDHPNILAPSEIGERDGRRFMVTEPPRGIRMRELIDAGEMTTRGVIEYGVQIAEGLAAAHDRGVVHGALEPDNIRVDDEGGIKILGFGLFGGMAPGNPAGEENGAAAAVADPGDGRRAVTVGYLSPEGVGGREIDERADIFSFGVVLYEMLTGLSPFRRVSAADSVVAILEEDPPPVSDNSSRVLPVFDGIVQRCLEKRPENRYRSARDVAAALGAIGEAPVVGKPRAAPRAQYGPMMIIPLIIAAALALAVLLAGYKALLRQTERPDIPQVVDTTD